MLSKIVTIENIPGYEVIEICGLVTGISVNSRTVMGNILGNLRGNFGGKNKGYTELYLSAQNEAIEDMSNMAEELNANAIIMVRFNTSQLDLMDKEPLVQFTTYGTAVKVRKLP